MSTSRASSYPAPDGQLTFDKLSSVFASGNRTRDDQPNHMRVQTKVPRELAELWAHMCPAQVYEVGEAGRRRHGRSAASPRRTASSAARSPPKAAASRRRRAAAAPSTHLRDSGARLRSRWLPPDAARRVAGSSRSSGTLRSRGPASTRRTGEVRLSRGAILRLCEPDRCRVARPGVHLEWLRAAGAPRVLDDVPDRVQDRCFVCGSAGSSTAFRRGG